MTQNVIIRKSQEVKNESKTCACLFDWCFFIESSRLLFTTPKEYRSTLPVRQRSYSSYRRCLTITLESNSTSGYSWNENANTSDNTVIQQTDHKYNLQQPLYLALVLKSLDYQALKAGNSTISMEYAAPSSRTQPSQNVQLDCNSTIETMHNRLLLRRFY